MALSPGIGLLEKPRTPTALLPIVSRRRSVTFAPDVKEGSSSSPSTSPSPPPRAVSPGSVSTRFPALTKTVSSTELIKREQLANLVDSLQSIVASHYPATLPSERRTTTLLDVVKLELEPQLEKASFSTIDRSFAEARKRMKAAGRRELVTCAANQTCAVPEAVRAVRARWEALEAGLDELELLVRLRVIDRGISLQQEEGDASPYLFELVVQAIPVGNDIELERFNETLRLVRHEARTEDEYVRREECSQPGASKSQVQRCIQRARRKWALYNKLSSLAHVRAEFGVPSLLLPSGPGFSSKRSSGKRL